jgi:hypothetical protein
MIYIRSHKVGLNKVSQIINIKVDQRFDLLLRIWSLVDYHHISNNNNGNHPDSNKRVLTVLDSTEISSTEITLARS